MSAPLLLRSVTRQAASAPDFAPAGEGTIKKAASRDAAFLMSAVAENAKIARSSSSTTWRLGMLHRAMVIVGNIHWSPVKRTHAPEPAPPSVAVLLDPRGAQAGKAMIVDRGLPGEEFLNRQTIALASLFKA